MKLRLLQAVPAAALMLLCTIASTQTRYGNAVNVKFRTVSSGPQSAVIVDVPAGATDDQVRAQVSRAAFNRRAVESAAVRRETSALPPRMRRNGPLVMVDTFIVRKGGRLARPLTNRAAGDNVINFAVPTAGDNSWTPAAAALLNEWITKLTPEIQKVIGAPGWSGTVTVLSKDPRLGLGDAIIGPLVVMNGQNIEIWFPSYSVFQNIFVGLAQAMAEAYHGPYRIAYDAWELGMAEAVAVIAAYDLQPTITQSGQTVDLSRIEFYSPFYDLLNQPALGNSTFLPPTPSNAPATGTITMLTPRMAAAGTAWLKCYIENPGFLAAFNQAYYAQCAGVPNTPNDVNALRNIVASALPVVEGLPFNDWFEQQFVFDTSVTVGRKLYVYFAGPSFPSVTDPDGAYFVTFYYNTTVTGDEISQNGTCYPVWWPFDFSTRLTLVAGDPFNISGGIGSTAPFFGGVADPMRITADFPVEKEYVRMAVPAHETGTLAAPNDISGVVLGANSGTLVVTFDGGGVINTTVAKGAFGALKASTVPPGFSRTSLLFTPDGGAPITYRRNTAFNNTVNIAPIFVLPAPAATTTLAHTFAAGPQMISLPVRPLSSDLAAVLGTTPSATLLAQYRQDSTGADSYSRYPTLAPYQPGYALWSNFAAAVSAQVKGTPTDPQKDVSVAVQFGWNQIGSPYSTSLNILSDLQFQYLGQDPLSYADALSHNWISAGVIGYLPTSGYVDVANPAAGTLLLNTMEAWKGYWIRVLVPEGLTITYSNPNNRSAARAKATATATKSNGWRLALLATDGSGTQAISTIGQDSNGSDAFVSSLDVVSPPPFTRGAGVSMEIAHPEWSTTPSLLTDIRRSGSRATWSITVAALAAGRTVTLTWPGIASLARGTSLSLTDSATGQTRLLGTSSGYTYTPSQGETSRTLRIDAQPAGRGLSIRNMVVSAPLSGGRAAAAANISFELSAPAETSVDVMSRGRLVRHLVNGRAAAAGANSLVWDLKDDRGASLSAGTYIVQVTARTQAGELTRTISILSVTR